MSLGARLAIAAALVAGLVLFVGALAGGDPDPVPVAPEPNTSNEGANTQTVGAAAPAKAGVLDSSETCKTCHPAIYAEWESDRHSRAWVGKLYTEISQQHKDPNCWSCHAPRPILETGLESPAEARANFREQGITCLSCHKMGNHVVGPRGGAEATPDCAPECGPRFDEGFAREGAQEATIQFCGVCHGLHGTDQEFKGSKYFRAGKTCLSCHMAETNAPATLGGPSRPRKVHRFTGGHSAAMLKRALAFTQRREKGDLVVRVTNEGAGHRVPTDARHRAIWVRVAFFDSFGQPVAVPDPNTNAAETEVSIDLIRLFYRHEQRDPTSIHPAGTLGEPNWRDSRIAVPAGAKGGSVRIRLWYCLRFGVPAETGTLIQEETVKVD
ncbi:MAG: cytochrome c family protein [Planctomycetota bacterium]|nr:cytochrome c family protein [Planctomycetota bacterium]